MNSIHKSIDQAFLQTMNTLSKKFDSVGKDNALYLNFDNQNPQLYFFSKGNKPKPICFTQMISLSMIGLGFTVEKVYLSLNSLKKTCQKHFNLTKQRLSFLLFSTKEKGIALVGLCVNDKHHISYYLSEVLQVSNSKYEQLN